jgi:HEPN domain-containing protein
MHKKTKYLLDRANDDLNTAIIPEVPEMPFGQHAHAAIEKYFKALLNEHENKFPKIHDLGGLAHLLRMKGEVIPVTSIVLSSLNDYASGFRYDDLTDILDRRLYLEAVNTIRDYVLGRIAQISGE